MSNKKRWPEEAPTLSPTFDMEKFARESERRIAQNAIETAPVPATVASVTVPKASPTGFDFDPEPEIGPSSVPVLLAVDATEVLSLPTESFLLGFVDGAR